MSQNPQVPTKMPSEFFNKSAASMYDERQQRLAPITDNLHFLISLVLKNLPAKAKILCVGVGTGSEIIKLAAANPSWQFTGVDPSADMLEVCKNNLESSKISSRVNLFHGYLSELSGAEKFDAVLCLFVTHFIKVENERQKLFDEMFTRLKPKGYLINSEISHEISTAKFTDLLEKWKEMQIVSGSTQEQLDQILPMWQQHLSIVPPPNIEGFLLKSGFATPVQFFQSLMIHAWYSQKS